jgi:hypothetical protein
MTTSDLEGLRRAQEAAAPFGLPVMIHMGQSVSPMRVILALLKRGDIVTHMYAPAPNGILDDDGLAFAVVLIYLLIVVNFQSWLDPSVIVMALPSALAGILWILFATDTTLSVPALTGAIMCMGVATANSILVISFARERMAAGLASLALATAT